MKPTTSPAGDASAPDTRWNAASAYTADEALAMDAWLVAERGCSITELMAVAGARVADAARALLRERSLARIVFLVGPGNNGGDGLVAERVLRGEVETQLWLPLPRTRAAEAVAGVGAFPARPDAAPPLLDARTLLVDGLFGVGLRRPLEGAERAAVERVNASDATVLAIDIPSGLHATTGEVPGARRGAAIRADVTLTFVGPKRGFFLGSGPAHVGAWRAVDIGFPPQLAHDWLARRRGAESTS